MQLRNEGTATQHTVRTSNILLLSFNEIIPYNYVQGYSGKSNQRGLTETYKGRPAHCPDLIHIPMKFHKDIPNSFRIMAHTRMFTDGQKVQ